MGIAVSTATDVAKSAAGIVLTKPGLSGIVASVKEGRITFQRILTYTMNSVTKKIVNVLFLAVGLIMTGHAILTPMLMVILMITGDFLAMSLTTDNVRPSPAPNVWQIGRLTVAGVIIGVCDLVFCVGVFAAGKFHLLLGLDALRTLALIALVFSGEASLYAIRERRRIWSSKPSRLVVASTIGDILGISALALSGIAMTALPVFIVAATLGAAVVFAFAVDAVKVPIFHRLKIT
jgi:H+-transporting ATPase